MAESEPHPTRIPKKYRGAVLFLRDAGVAALLVALILLTMFAYTGQWPPLVVVESNSMMHGDDNQSHIGTIDTGDLVLVKKVDTIADVVTYTQGFVSGHRSYGDYGDVIIYKVDGRDTRTPIIHRAIIYLEANQDGMSYRSQSLRDLPPEKWSVSDIHDTWDHLTSVLYINGVGYTGSSVTIDIGRFSKPFSGGYITKGDHNSNIDQFYGSTPVQLNWVVGKATGEIPWFGLLKLWSTHTLGSPAPSNSVRDLWITLAVIVIVPILIDIFLTYREKRNIASKRNEQLAEEQRSASSDEDREKDGG